MKEKVKEFLLYFLIIFAIFVVTGSIVRLIKYPSKIELHDTEENLTKLSEYKNEANDLLEVNACHDAIKGLITFYEETSYDGVVELGKDIENAPSPMKPGLALVSNCSKYKADFEEYNVSGKILANTVLFEELFYNSKYFEYEIKIKDIFSRESYASNITSLEYNVERKLELELISDLLDIVRKEKKYGE